MRGGAVTKDRLKARFFTVEINTGLVVDQSSAGSARVVRFSTERAVPASYRWGRSELIEAITRPGLGRTTHRTIVYNQGHVCLTVELTKAGLAQAVLEP
ncbi:hypothetical protein J6590_018532 [Homalodisca vitripennis]|nr:hypothetical protein J6590_018532 [Homalodisca vitripennis]